MAKSPDPSGESSSPVNPLVRFGANVRSVRIGRSLTQTHLGNATGYSKSYVCGVETGQLIPSHKFAEGCDKAFGTNGLFTGMLYHLEEGDHPTQFVPYVQLEQKASSVRNFSATIIDGLLQTEEYARAIFKAGHPDAPEDVIDGKVAARIRRREILAKPKPPSVWMVLHEASLRAPVGGRAAMARQLAFLLESAERPGVDVQVIPFSVGAEGIHSEPFTVLKFQKDPPVVYTDDPQGGRVCRTYSVVQTQKRRYDRLLANALPLSTSLATIDKLRKEYAS